MPFTYCEPTPATLCRSRTNGSAPRTYGCGGPGRALASRSVKSGVPAAASSPVQGPLPVLRLGGTAWWEQGARLCLVPLSGLVVVMALEELSPDLARPLGLGLAGLLVATGLAVGVWWLTTRLGVEGNELVVRRPGRVLRVPVPDMATAVLVRDGGTRGLGELHLMCPEGTLLLTLQAKDWSWQALLTVAGMARSTQTWTLGRQQEMYARWPQLARRSSPRRG